MKNLLLDVFDTIGQFIEDVSLILIGVVVVILAIAILVCVHLYWVAFLVAAFACMWLLSELII